MLDAAAVTVLLPLRVFVVDDEAPARARLKSLLEDCAEILPNEVVGEAASGGEALAALAVKPVDVVLLDIRMPGIDGIEVARKLAAQPQPPAVVFVTAYDAHAVSAFEVQARDYLLKPVRKDRLLDALRRIRPQTGAASMADQPHFTVSDRGRVLRVLLSDVLYLRAELKYVTLRTREREYVLDVPLVKLEEAYPNDLLRIHRNCLINRAWLIGFEQQRDGDEACWVAVLKEWPEKLPVSRRQLHVVRDFRVS
jgi:two-component system response regulator AlgR